jgi:predicted Zn-dependent protease
MFLVPGDVKTITDRLLARSTADACVVTLEGGEEQSLRFARGGVTTNMTTADVTLRIASHIDGRIGAVSTSNLHDEAALAQAQTRSEEIARLLPVDPDYVAPLGPQTYAVSQRYDETTATLALDALAQQAALAIAQGAEHGAQMFGCATGGRRFEAMATSEGLFAYDRRSEIELSTTARNEADTWSGWAGANELDARRLDAEALGRRAAMKAAQRQAPVDLDPGRYSVVFEPVATAELARWLLGAMDARAAEEGRSFFSRKGGGALQGEALFDPKLTLRCDPADALAPDGAIGFEGLAQRKRAFIRGGVVETLYRSRAYAQKTQSEAVAHPRNLIVDGGETSLDAMIRSVKRGVLVTRLWYANMVDPCGLLLTGLTRDGNFLIENGRIVAPARNMRFNENLGSLFAKIAALGPSERTWRAMSAGGTTAAPPMLVEAFNFASQSSGV